MTFHTSSISSYCLYFYWRTTTLIRVISNLGSNLVFSEIEYFTYLNLWLVSLLVLLVIFFLLLSSSLLTRFSLVLLKLILMLIWSWNDLSVASYFLFIEQPYILFGLIIEKCSFWSCIRNIISWFLFVSFYFVDYLVDGFFPLSFSLSGILTFTFSYWLL
jgi:hypothetical protein